MKLSNLFTSGLMIIGLVMASCQDDAMESELPTSAVAEPSANGQYIVVFKEDAVPHGRLGEPTFTSRADKAAYSRTNQIRVAKRVQSFLSKEKVASGKADRVFSSALAGFAAEMTAAEAQKVAQDPTVAFVEPDREITLDYQLEEVYTKDELLTEQSNARQTTTCATSNAGGAGDGSNREAFIWIVDTGIDLDHPDLNVNTEFGRAFVDGSPDDAQGHGTHVAGIAGAIANDVGILGVSAGAPVVPVDVFGNGGSTFTSTIISGMDYVAANDLAGDVVNMSLGPRNRTGCDTNSAYRLALERLNNQSLVALAAGNSNDDAAFYDPACQNLSNVYTVASMTCNGNFSSFSNFGEPVDWIATGSSVTSTYPGGGYATLSGTSMASPVVAGILHQRGRAPQSCGSVTFEGRSYPVACR